MAAKLVSALVSGLLFGIGLTVSQMINPAKVLNFLDVAGHWDPTLLLVMAGAVLVTGPGFLLVRRSRRSLFGGDLQVPVNRVVDGRLLGGAAIFGIGWGLVGFCPGPAMAALSTGRWPVAVFVVSMIAGMVLYRRFVGNR
jgi:uncharacterized membrane protein YedE/YeeE